MKKKRIDFIGIGVVGGATTWVAQCFKEHPDIFMPDVKEMHFFNTLVYFKGLDFYHSYFDFTKKCGEITPDYIYDRLAPGRIYDYKKKIKLFLILRHPTTRAIEQYKIEVIRNGINVSFREAFDKDLLGIRTRGLYHEQIERYRKLKNLKIMFYEEIKSRPLSFINELFRFIGVKKFTPPSVDKIVLPANTAEVEMSMDEIGEIDYYYEEIYKNTERNEDEIPDYRP